VQLTFSLAKIFALAILPPTCPGLGLALPGTRPQIIDNLDREINAALTDPRMKGRIADPGSVAFPRLPAELAKSIAADTEKWGNVTTVICNLSKGRLDENTARLLDALITTMICTGNNSQVQMTAAFAGGPSE
jgi:hypothetical protein